MALTELCQPSESAKHFVDITALNTTNANLAKFPLNIASDLQNFALRSFL